MESSNITKLEYKKGDIWNNTLVHEYNAYVQNRPLNHEFAYIVYCLLCESSNPYCMIRDPSKITTLCDIFEKRDAPFSTYSIHFSGLRKTYLPIYMAFLFLPLKTITSCVQLFHHHIQEGIVFHFTRKALRGAIYCYVLGGLGINRLSEDYWPYYTKKLRLMLEHEEAYSHIVSHLKPWANYVDSLYLCGLLLFAYSLLFSKTYTPVYSLFVY